MRLIEPPVGESGRQDGARLLELVQVMDRLRRECPWDQRQTHESLVRYLVEETYEVVEAIENGDRDHLREELGDLLLQVVFHARIAGEDVDRPFDVDDVAAGIVAKLISRHPHVFAGVEVADAAEVERNWEALKATEKTRQSPLDGIPPGLPALLLADKVISRLRHSRVVEPVESTTDAATEPEVVSTSSTTEGEVTSSTTPSWVSSRTEITVESVGDALFDLVAAASAAGIDAELALRARVHREMAAVRAAAQRALPAQEFPPG
jgi:XTP/dITP diphosphohydrolase